MGSHVDNSASEQYNISGSYVGTQGRYQPGISFVGGGQLLVVNYYCLQFLLITIFSFTLIEL